VHVLPWGDIPTQFLHGVGFIHGGCSAPSMASQACALLHTLTSTCSARLWGMKASDRDPSTRPPTRLEGDIVVTRVARHYAIGRVNADRLTQTPIETQNSRADALSRACALAGADHQVFLYERAEPSDCVHIECDDSKTLKSVHGERRFKPR
jgi:hypothetical protein